MLHSTPAGIYVSKLLICTGSMIATTVPGKSRSLRWSVTLPESSIKARIPCVNMRRRSQSLFNRIYRNSLYDDLQGNSKTRYMLQINILSIPLLYD
jgi:hypothetical protein